MICFGQHTTITSATAHSLSSTGAVTVRNDACDFPVFATAHLTFTVRVWATVVILLVTIT